MVSEHCDDLPSNLIRRLANPTEVMTLERVVRLQDELGTHGARTGERINIDVQVTRFTCGYHRTVVAAPSWWTQLIFSGQVLGVVP